jgi:aryl-alcohol dehydrogenase-like predicted oxidoreductase
MKPLPKAPFGRTGHMSTRTLFGAAAFFDVDQITADRTMDLLMDWGVNHIDTAASYGKAEKRLGPWLKHNRKDVFLATKTEERTYRGAREELHRSLELMNVDSVDLWQMHVLIRQDEWQTAMGEGGALEAFIEAREQGLVKWLGVTGHGVGVANFHARSLERFDFDSVLLPWNWPMSRNADYAADFRKLHAQCLKKNVAFQLIKTVCRRAWPEGAEKTRACWYEPLEDQGDIDAAVQWALGVEGSFLNTIGDVDLLPRVLEAASRFESAPSDEELARRAEEGSWAPLFAKE